MRERRLTWIASLLYAALECVLLLWTLPGLGYYPPVLP